MIIARAQMRVFAQLSCFAPHDQQRFGMDFVADHTVYHMRADLLQFRRPADISLLVKARHQLDHHRDLLAILRCANQRLHQLRIRPRAVHRHLDRHHIRGMRRIIQPLDHRRERLVRMVQQNIALADGLKNIATFAQLFIHAHAIRGKFQRGLIDPIGHLHQPYQIHRPIDAIHVVLIQAKLCGQERSHRR